MAEGSVTSTDAGNVRYAASIGSVTVGVLDARSAADRASALLSGQAGWGAVSILAGTAILDTVEVVTSVDVYASSLRLSATAVGQSTNALETEVATLSAAVGSGGLFVLESSAIAIDQTASIIVNRVALDGSSVSASDSAQSDLISAGNTVLNTTAGSITVNQGNLNDSGVLVTGNLLLNAGGTSDLIVNAKIVSTAGNISLNASRDIVQHDGISAQGTGKSIDMLASHDISMDLSSLTQSANGNLLLQAGNNVTLESLVAGSGNISVTAIAGNIADLDTLGDTEIDISGAGLLLKAGNGIGSGSVALGITVSTLTASAGAGGMYLNETDGLTLGTLTVQANRVDATGATTLTTNAAQSDLITSANGNIVLVSNSGTLSLNDGDSNSSAVSANGSGNVLIAALGSNATLSINAGVNSGSGNVTLSTTNALTVGAAVNLSAGAGASLLMTSSAGAVTLAGSDNASAGTIRIVGAIDVALGNLTATSVSIIASAGSISNASGSSTNVSATDLRLQAGTAIGSATNPLSLAVSHLSAAAANGSMSLSQTGAITITSVAVAAQQVNADGSTSLISDAAQADLTTGGNGNIVLVTQNGAITLNDGDANGSAVAANGSGNVLLQARGAGNNLQANANVSSGSGHLTLLAANDLNLAASAAISTSQFGDIDLEAAAGAINQSFGSSIANLNGNVRLLAATDVNLSSISSAGNVSVTAGGAILQPGGTALNITAAGLRLSAGSSIGTLGASASAIEISVSAVSARAASGGINLAANGDVGVADVAVSVNKVNGAGAVATVTDAKQSDLRTSANGSIVLAATGAIFLTDGTAGANDGSIAANGSGNVLVSAGDTVIVSADILSGSGNVTALGVNLVSFAANAGIRTGAAGNIDVEASSGAVVQATSSVLASGSGNLRIAAATNVTVGNIASAGTVWINATSGFIRDADALVAGRNDSHVNIVAGALRMAAGGSIGIVDTVGTTDNAIETTVGTLSAVAGGAIGIVETDDLIVGQVTASVQVVALNGSVSTVGAAAQADLRTSGANGHIVVSTLNGNISLNDGDANGSAVAASGNVVLRAVGGSVFGNASVSSVGQLTVKADLNVMIAAGASFSAASGGALSIDAAVGSIQMAGTASASAAGNARLHAGNDITLGNVSAANVSITSDNGAILNAAGSTKNVSASTLRLHAADSIGTAARHLSTAVATVSASSSGTHSAGIYLTDDDAISVGSVAVSVSEFNLLASTVVVTDAAQADLIAGNNGNIVLTTVAGAITLNDGDSNGSAVAANGIGSVLLQAGGAGSDLSVNAGISSASGNLTLKAARNIAVNGTATVSTGGSLSLDASAGAIVMAGGVNATAGNVRLHATGAVTLGNLSATDISVVADTGAIVNAAGSIKNLVATHVRLQAAGSIGSAVRNLTTAVGTLTANSSAAGVFITEDDAVTIGSVAVTVTELRGDGSTAVVTDAAQADLVSGNNGAVALTTLNGSITLTDGDSNGVAVSANGAGSITLRANGAASNLVANANLISASGAVSVSAGNSIVLNSGVTFSTSANNMTLDANGGTLTMAGTAAATSTAGSLRLHAAGDVTLGNASASNVSVVADSGAILNAVGSSKNLTATNLRLHADGTVGTAARHLTTAAGTLSASSNGNTSAGIYLTQDTAVTVGSVGFGVDPAQADLVAGNNGNIVLSTVVGNITLNDGDGNGSAVVANGSGSVLLQAGGDLLVNANVTSASGNLTQKAAGNIVLAAGTTLATTGSLSLDASGGALTMAGNAIATAGSARMHAASDVVLGNLNAASVSVLSDIGAIQSAAGSIKNVSGNTLRLHAGTSIGSGLAALTTAVGTLSASAGGGIFVSEDDAVTVGSVAVSVTELRGDASSVVVSDAAQADLVSGNNGNIVLNTTNGSIVLNDGDSNGIAVRANGSGNITLQANGASSNIVVNASVFSTGGAINLRAANGLTINGAATVASSGNAMALDAGAGALTMAGTANVAATGGDLRLHASGDITLGNASATNLSVVSDTASILNAAGSSKNLSATNLRLHAENAIGSAARHLTTAVGTLSASANGTAASGIYLTQDASIIIGSVGFGVDPAQADLVTGHNGNIVLTTVAGGITLTDGNTNGSAVSANGSGNVLLQANGGGIAVNSAVQSGSGAIGLIASGAMAQNAAISTTGTVDAQTQGAITMVDGSVTSGSNVRYAAGGDVVVARLAATGNVSLVAGGSILTATSASATQPLNVSATGLRMQAGGSIGAAGSELNTTVSAISAQALTGSINVRETDGLTVTAAGVAVAVNRVDGQGATSALVDAAVAGVSAPHGNIALTTTTGAVVFGTPITAAPGSDISIVGDTFVVSQPLIGQGGNLLITPSNPALNIQIGGTPVAGSLTLEQTSLANIVGGFGNVIIGGGASAPGQDIHIVGTPTPVVFHDGLILNVTGPGSLITVAGHLTAGALDARAAVQIDGPVTISAGNGAQVAGGNMVFEHSIDGVTPNAQLTLAAGGDSVVFSGPIGSTTPLAGLKIGNAADVTFSQPVVVNGNVAIDATGVVRFDSTLNISSGSLIIHGASQVIIGDVVMSGTAGVFVIEANTLTLNGNVSGADTVVLRPTDLARHINLAGPDVVGDYNISTATLAHLSTVHNLVVGTQGADGHAAAGAGGVTVTAVDFGALTAAPLRVYGSDVIVPAASGTLHAAHGITLDGRNSVVLHDCLATTSGDVVLYSANGGVTMDAGVAVTTPAQLTVQGAGDLRIGQLHADSVVLRSSGGTISDASADASVNIVANTVAIYGYGPKIGSGNAVHVQAPSVFVSAPAGMVLQDTGTDGRTHFFVLNGATMYEQVIGVGAVTRPTQDPSPVAAPVVLPTGLLPASPALVSYLPSEFSSSVPTGSSVASYLGGLVTSAASAPGGLVLAGSQGMTRLSAASSFTLGTPGMQSLSTGAAVSDNIAFDYWLEDIVI